MSNVLFGWPLASDTATLSGGSWVTTLPLTNLQTDALGTVARSVDDSNASTLINVDYGAAQALSVVALVRHNLRSAATWRVRGSTVSNFATSVYDSGAIAVWSEQWPVGALPSGHPNATTRLLTDAQIDALNPPRDALQVFTEVSARYWRIELFDDTNTDGYVQIGRLVMAPRVQPSMNMVVGADFGYDDRTLVGRALSGAKFFDVRPKARTLSLAFQNLSQPEGMMLRTFFEAVGVHDQLYTVVDPSDVEILQQRAFLATQRQMSSVQLAAVSYLILPVVLEEVI